MIKRYQFSSRDLPLETSKEMQLFSIISQSFFQPFSLTDNLLVILTALTAGPGVGFNRAMLFLAEGDVLKGEMWLGPPSLDEAASVWQVLSTSDIGYPEIIEHNRNLLTDEGGLTRRLQEIVYSLHQERLLIPTLPVSCKEIILVQDARNERLVDKKFIDFIDVDEFLCIPLFTREEILGEIVMDNAITQQPILEKDIELARVCGLIAGNYIYTSRLQKRVLEMKRLTAMGEMAMFVTHQVRTPAVIIGAYANQLLDPGIEESKRKRNVQIIWEEIQRMEKILDRLSRFIRVEIKNLAPMDVQELLTLVFNSVRSEIKNKKARVTIEVEENLPAVLCDPVHAAEALKNVLENALDALVNEREVRICATRESPEWVVITVQDTGRGIPDSVKPRIFEALVSTKEKGMGLGLVYVKRVIDACGGKIDVESEEGKGSKFKLYFQTEEKGNRP